MTKKLGLIVILSICLLIFNFTSAQRESHLPPSSSPEGDSPPPVTSSPEADSPPPVTSSPDADSPPPLASSPEPEPLPDSPPPPPPPPPPQPESPSPSPSRDPAPAPAPSKDDSSDDPEQETEYFPSPSPSEKPEDMEATQDKEGFEEEGSRDDGGMSGLKKAGIAIGVILGVGAIVIGAMVYKKRRDNLIRARYTYFSQGDFL